MSDESKRGSDSVIDWSSSPIDWSSSPIGSSSLAGESAPAQVAPSLPPPPQSPAVSDDDEVEVAPEDLEDLFDDPERVERSRAHAAREQHASRGEPARFPQPPPAVTRSPFAALLYLAFAGVLAWFAFHAYEEMGRLHVRSRSAALRELDTIRESHQRLTIVAALHALPAAAFGLGALFLLTRKRGTGLFFGLVGIGITIFTLYLSVRIGDHGLLRPDDVLLKLCGLAAVAWFRPRGQ
jgi:hypothetical protein